MLGGIHWKSEAGGSDSNNRVGFAVQRDVLTKNAGICSILGLPEFVAQNRVSPVLFFTVKSPAQTRCDSQHGEKVCRNNFRVDVQRGSDPSQRGTAVPKCSHVFE